MSRSSTTSFNSRSKKGKTMKIVKEHYTREDLPCGSPLCLGCTKLMSSSSSTLIYSQLSDESCALPYTIVDTNIVLHSIDALENPAFMNLIFPQRVLDEVKSNNTKACLIFKFFILTFEAAACAC